MIQHKGGVFFAGLVLVYGLLVAARPWLTPVYSRAFEATAGRMLCKSAPDLTNRTQRRPDDPKGKADRGEDAERWGLLPMYKEFVKNRGGRLQVPEKYRKFHEAFLKSQNRERKSGR